MQKRMKTKGFNLLSSAIDRRLGKSPCLKKFQRVLERQEGFY